MYDECEIRMNRFLMTRARKSIRREFFGNPSKTGAKKNVRQILSKPELTNILSSYDCSGLPDKYKLVFWAMKYKLVNALWLIRKKL